MDSGIVDLIVACEWFPSHYLIFSQNVYTPFLYYTYFGSAVPALLIGIFIFIHQRNNLASRLLLLTTLSLAIWVFGSLVLWATEYPSYVMFFWTLIDIAEPFVYFFAFYFAYAFIYKRDLSSLQKIVFSIPLLPTILLAPTSLMLVGFDLSNCDRNAFEGLAALYGYSIELLYVVFILLYAVRALLSKSIVERTARKQMLIFTAAIVAFLLAFSLGNILELFTENTLIGQYGLLGAPVFTAVLAYLIVKFEVFNIKMIGAEALVVAIWLSVFSLLFLSPQDNGRFIVILTLLLLILMGRRLIKSVAAEIENNKYNQQLAHDLAEANARLKDLDKTKSEFLSIASHQLRTPLTAIRGFIGLMLDGSYGKLPAKFVEPSTHIDESARYMALSINDFLNVSRIESGQMKYEKCTFSLLTVVENLSDELRPIALKKGLSLMFRNDVTTDMIVKADEGKVRQAIQNIVDNAMKYTPKGSITVVAHDDLEAGKVYISVIDTGLGMSEETKKILFNKFERAKNASTANMQGTGLGLYIAKQMIEAMGGTIESFSKGEGSGSTFRLGLPLATFKTLKK